MRAQVRIDFQGRGNVEAFSRACVQAMRDGVQLALRVARQVGTLGQVSAQQSIGQRFTQQSRHMPEYLREARTGTPCIRPVHPSQEHQACDARHQGADRRAIARALDQVAFPVAGHRPGRDLGRTRRATGRPHRPTA